MSIPIDQMISDSNYEEYDLSSPVSNLERGVNSTPTSTSHCFSTFSLYPRISSFAGGRLIMSLPKKERGKRIADLSDKLEAEINKSLIFPIEYLESKLFDLCREYYLNMDTKRPVLGVLASMHPIIKLQDIDGINCVKWNHLQESYISYNPNAIAEYTFLKSFIQFLNDLSIVWDITNIYNYRQRFNHDLEVIGLIDLESFFTSIINPEIMWLSTTANAYPLREVLSDEVKSLALLMQSKFIALFFSFMQSNKENIKLTDSIAPWLSYKNPLLHKEYHLAEPSKESEPKYQHLSASFSFKFWKKTSISLKQDLEDFEFVYRYFESSLLKSICSMYRNAKVGHLNFQKC